MDRSSLILDKREMNSQDPRWICSLAAWNESFYRSRLNQLAAFDGQSHGGDDSHHRACSRSSLARFVTHSSSWSFSPADCAESAVKQTDH